MISKRAIESSFDLVILALFDIRHLFGSSFPACDTAKRYLSPFQSRTKHWPDIDSPGSALLRTIRKVVPLEYLFDQIGLLRRFRLPTGVELPKRL